MFAWYSTFLSVRSILLSILQAFRHLWLHLSKKDLSLMVANEESFLQIPDLYDATISQLLNGLDMGLFTTVQLVQAYITRIDEVNLKGPELRAVLEVNAAALVQARQCDEERSKARKNKTELGILHGIPILVKDNIATSSPPGQLEMLNTSAGSLALLGCFPAEDAAVVHKLRSQGAIILGKASMSEWANWRDILPGGWSSRGGQCTNPYYPNADPEGSSSGPAVAAAIGLAAATLGTETDGSISTPSSFNNVVGLKPTVGLTSRRGVIPLSVSCDSIGPICRTISDAALMLQAIAGPDRQDPHSLEQPQVPDYISSLNVDFIRGKRIGVLRGPFCDGIAWPRESNKVSSYRVSCFDEAVGTIRDTGASVLDCVEIPTAHEVFNDNRAQEFLLFCKEFKAGINEYLANIPDSPTGVRSLTDIIEFNRKHKEAHFKGSEKQNWLIASDVDVEDAVYQKALDFARRKGGSEGIDACLKEHNLDILVAPYSERSSTLSALAGYPTLTVPLGFLPDSVTGKGKPAPLAAVAPGMPFGLVFIGPKWSERTLLGCAYAYEQKSKTRWKRRAYKTAIPRTQIATFQ